MSYGGSGYRDYNNRNNYHNQNNRGWRDNNNNNNNNNSYYGGGNRYQHQQQNSQYYSRNQNNYHNNNNNYNNNRYSNNNNSNQNQRWNNTHNENNNYEFQTKSYQNKSGSPSKQGQQYQTTQSGAAAAAAVATPVEAAPAKAKSPSQENDKNKSKNKWSASASSSSEEELDARHDFWDEEEEDVNVYHLIYYDEDYERAQDITMDLLEHSEDSELTDKDESTLRCYLGTIYTRGYEYHYEAKEEFEKAIKLDDENDLAYYEYGDMLYELEQYTQALKYFEKACQLKPNNSLYKDDYNEAKDEIERDRLEDAPMPQELVEPCAPADGEDDGFVDDREDYEREENDDANDANDANDGKAQGSKATKNTEQAQGYNNKKLGSMPEDKEANVGYEDNEEEYDDDDDEYGDEDEYSSEFERFWDSFSQWDNEDEDYYYAFEEHGLDDIRILVTQKLNDDFEKKVLNDQIGMSKEHSGYFMKRLMQLQKDNGDFKSWLQSVQLFDEYYTNVFEDNEIVTFNAFYYWIQSKDDLLEYIASDTIDENSTDFKLLWETNPRYVRNHPNDKDGVLLCSACQQKINENGQNFQENDNGNNNDNAPTKQNGK